MVDFTSTNILLNNFYVLGMASIPIYAMLISKYKLELSLKAYKFIQVSLYLFTIFTLYICVLDYPWSHYWIYPLTVIAGTSIMMYSCKNASKSHILTVSLLLTYVLAGWDELNYYINALVLGNWINPLHPITLTYLGIVFYFFIKEANYPLNFSSLSIILLSVYLSYFPRLNLNFPFKGGFNVSQLAITIMQFGVLGGYAVKCGEQNRS